MTINNSISYAERRPKNRESFPKIPVYAKHTISCFVPDYLLSLLVSRKLFYSVGAYAKVRKSVFDDFLLGIIGSYKTEKLNGNLVSNALLTFLGITSVQAR